METSSEGAVLTGKVCQKRKGRALCPVAWRIAWTPDGKDRFTVSLMDTYMKCQKISPDKKAKLQLQLVLQVGVAANFHFSNESSAVKAQMQ